MRAYWTFARVSMLEALQYRVEWVIFFLGEVLPPLMMAYFWLVAYEAQDVVAGFGRDEMLAYTIGTITMRSIVTVRVEWTLDWEIRQGALSAQLTKPFNFWGYLFVNSVAWKSTRLIFVIPITAAFVAWLGPNVAAVNLTWDRALLLLVSIALAYITCFFLKLCVAFTGFWTNDIVGIVTTYEVVASVLGGVLVPIALLPGWLQTVAQLLPLHAIYTIPLSIMLGRDAGADPLVGIALQLGWIAALWVIASALWRAGLKQYESVGG